jgi:Flp pilus assembly protein TadD
MRFFARARLQVKSPLERCRERCSLLRNARFVFGALFWVSTSGVPGFGQDSGSTVNEFRGNGAQITVTVHDGAGEPISSPALVRLYHDSRLSGQGSTSHGSMIFVVTSLGEFMVVVQAGGYAKVEKEVSVDVEGKAQVDVYLRAESLPRTSVGVPGRPILAPKAQQEFDRGLRALGADKLYEAEKSLTEAARLAPGHPDVLYAQGVLYLKQQNYSQAQSALEQATQVDPNHAKAFAALGMALVGQAKYEVAIAPLEQSMALDAAADVETQWVLARAYYHSGRYDEALQRSQLALIAAKGRMPEIGLLVAQSLTAVGKYEEAAQILREFLRQHADGRDAPKARRWLEGLRNSGKIPQ